MTIYIPMYGKNYLRFTKVIKLEIYFLIKDI